MNQANSTIDIRAVCQPVSTERWLRQSKRWDTCVWSHSKVWSCPQIRSHSATTLRIWKRCTERLLTQLPAACSLSTLCRSHLNRSFQDNSLTWKKDLTTLTAKKILRLRRWLIIVMRLLGTCLLTAKSCCQTNSRESGSPLRLMFSKKMALLTKLKRQLNISVENIRSLSLLKWVLRLLTTL